MNTESSFSAAIRLLIATPVLPTFNYENNSRYQISNARDQTTTIVGGYCYGYRRTHYPQFSFFKI